MRRGINPISSMSLGGWGLLDTATSSSAVDGDVRSGKQAFANGKAVNGALPVQTGGAVTPGASAVTKPAGIYDTDIVVAAVTVPAAKVLAGTTIAGTAGTMPAYGSEALTAIATAVSGTGLYFNGPAGHYETTTSIVASDSDFIASNIRTGINLFGLTGSLVEGKKYATGSVTSASGGAVQVTGLAFNPSMVILLFYTGGYYYRYLGYSERWLYGGYVTDYNGAPYTSGHANSIASWGAGFSVNIGFGSTSVTWLAYA